MKVFQIHAKSELGSEQYLHANTMTEVCLAVKELLDSGTKTSQITVNKYKGGDTFEVITIGKVMSAGRHPSRDIFER